MILVNIIPPNVVNQAVAQGRIGSLREAVPK